MSWSANIDSTTQIKDNFGVAVTYTNGIQTFSEIYNFGDITQVKQTIINKIKQLDTLDAQKAEVVIGPVAVDVVIDPPPPTPDPDEVQFLQDINTIRKFKRAIDLGVKTDKDLDYLAVVASMQAGLSKKPTLIDLL